MKLSVSIALAMVLSAQASFAADAPLKFLERRNLSTPQEKPFAMPETPKDVRERNKQVVLDFYKVISDKRQWTDENRKKYFADDFIQHDPGEPNTSEAFFNFFRTMGPPGGQQGGAPPQGMGDGMTAGMGGEPPEGMGSGPMGMVGTASFDSNNSPVNWMVAEGDIVMVARHRNYEWKDGPTPVYNGVFVDIWRLENGKIKEQWCSASPSDSDSNRIKELMKAGKFPKNKNWD
jgi:predicted SnoaL-like aldol condensation-catalyzing enzyme